MTGKESSVLGASFVMLVTSARPQLTFALTACPAILALPATETASSRAPRIVDGRRRQARSTAAAMAALTAQTRRAALIPAITSALSVDSYADGLISPCSV